jgi:cell division transport system ATP-binding protein
LSLLNLDGNAPAELPVIKFDHVVKGYKKDVFALQDVSFRIYKGEFVFIVGASGSGKSTMIKLMLREINPNSGKIFVAGRQLSRLRSWQVCKYRRTLGVVFQDFRLLTDRTVYDNVAFAQRVIETPQQDIIRQTPQMLAMVGLEDKENAYPGELSGGEAQRVSLARALVNNPLIVLADEPTGNLDPKNAWEMMHMLEEVNRIGMTVVVVTHNVEIVESMKKRTITMKNGCIVSDVKAGLSSGIDGAYA